MAIRQVKPTTPGRRFRIAPDFSALTQKRPARSLLFPIKRSGGRNNRGRITVPHRGGGHKRRGRAVTFKRCKWEVPAVVKTVEYDPVRTAFIMLVCYRDGEKAYLIAPKGIHVGDEIVAGEHVAPELGNAMPLKSMPVGTVIHNVELHPGRGGTCVRSAGSWAKLMALQERHAVLKMPSGEVRMVDKSCLATVGAVSNPDHGAVVLAKAGRKRWQGRRPWVRGTAMNPVDHPNGGGEGKTKGRQPSSKGGIVKGYRTRWKKKYSTPMILKRRK